MADSDPIVDADETPPGPLIGRYQRIRLCDEDLNATPKHAHAELWQSEIEIATMVIRHECKRIGREIESIRVTTPCRPSVAAEMGLAEDDGFRGLERLVIARFVPWPPLPPGLNQAIGEDACVSKFPPRITFEPLD